MANTPRYVELIKKRAASDIKFFERKGIKTDKDIYWKRTSDRAIMGAWQDPELQKLDYHERIRKISSIMVFPTEMSRNQAESLRKASDALGNPLAFEDVLKGKFDWKTLDKLKEQKANEYEGLYGPARARTLASQYISQTIFGSK